MSTATALPDRFTAALLSLRTIPPHALVAPRNDRERAGRRLIRLMAGCVPGAEDGLLEGFRAMLGHPGIQAHHLRRILADKLPDGDAEPELSLVDLRALALELAHADDAGALTASCDGDRRRLVTVLSNLLTAVEHVPGDWGRE